ncbi:hypothetical protein [Streptomyces sp. YKOK-I1]
MPWFTVVAVGARLLPETVPLRRIAGAEREVTARWTGVKIPEVYQPLTGTMRRRIRKARHS